MYGSTVLLRGADQKDQKKIIRGTEAATTMMDRGRPRRQ